MSAQQPSYVRQLLVELTTDQTNIQQQCGAQADPLFQDWRYNIICDTLHNFQQRGVTITQLKQWVKELQAVYPWSPAYDVFRQIINRRFVFFPWLIAMTTNSQQVQQALSIARQYNIPLCTRGGAHAYEPYSITDGIVIDQSRRTSIYLNRQSKQVTIEPGVLNGPLAAALGQSGLAIAQGTCANVGVVGLCLGGGMGFLGRRFGLSCDNLLSCKIITADGQERRVDADHESELFWALRGAGNGNFGLITEMTLQAHEVSQVIVFELRWPIQALTAVMTTFFDWLAADNGVGIELNVYALSQDYPVQITGLYAGSYEHLLVYLQAFKELKPTKQEIWSSSYVEAARHFTYNKFPPPYFKGKSYYAYRALPISVVPIIEKYMKVAGPNDRLEINGLGGAYLDQSQATAYAHRSAKAWIQYLTRWGMSADHTDEGWEDDEIGQAKLKWISDFYQAVKEAAGSAIQGAYVGCFDSQLENYLDKYYGANLLKLQEIKAKWDPHNFFRYPQAILAE